MRDFKARVKHYDLVGYTLLLAVFTTVFAIALPALGVDLNDWGRFAILAGFGAGFWALSRAADRRDERDGEALARAIMERADRPRAGDDGS